jgi:hypothetical protein
MNSTIATLWIGVVFLVLAGLLTGYNFYRFVKGRYFAEWHSAGATRALLGLIRWCWALIFAEGTIMFFVGAWWLANYALSQ